MSCMKNSQWNYPLEEDGWSSVETSVSAEKLENPYLIW